MSVSKPIAALAAGCLLMSVAALAQTGGGGPRSRPSPAVQAIVLEELARIDWIERSDVAALREGVIESMELQIGMPVKKGGTIGVLHHEMAELTVTKNKLQAESIGPHRESKGPERRRRFGRGPQQAAQRAEGRAWSRPRTSPRPKASSRSPTPRSRRPTRTGASPRPSCNLAKQTLEEHTIVAPFDGVIIKRMKNPGESVRANEAVVQLGNLNKLCADAYVPLDYAFRVKEGQVVEIQPRITQGKGEPLAIEKKRFRGKITFIDPQIQPVAETAVRIRAEFENPTGELRPGLMVQMTIFLNPEVAAAGPDGAAPTQTVRNQ